MQRNFVPEGRLIGTAENTGYVRNEAGLRLAKQTNKTLEGIVVSCDRALNLKIELGSITGIIPYAETVYSPDNEKPKDIAVITRVGKPVCFKITDMIDNGAEKFALLSRAMAQKECMDEYVSYLRPGDVIRGRVTHTEKFGAFIDVGCGVTALLPIDCISVSRISSASDRLKAGDDIRCIVSRVENNPFRLFLTVKELLGTWEENAANFLPGQTVRGIVRGIENYGVFIELLPNLSGLSEYRDDVEPGDETAVYIKSIDPKKMKVKLVIVGKQGKAQPTPLKYYVPESVTHIYNFVYSTPLSSKIIETDFI